MPSDLRSILTLEVPLIVLLGERRVRVAEVTAWVPGAIVEIPKHAEEELQILINNKVIGTGVAVKVGENFGVRITYIGDIKDRIQALSTPKDTEEEAAPPPELVNQAA
jgi:flagellar motor switch protein FliN/FliY